MTRRVLRQPRATRNTSQDLSSISNEDLKQKLEFVMGPPNQPDADELTYSGPRYGRTPHVLPGENGYESSCHSIT